MNTVAVILLSVCFLLILIGFYNIQILRLKIYFGNMDLYNHPYLEKIIKNSLHKIAKKENVGVFDIPFDELNKDEEKKACGAYINIFPETEEDKKYVEKIRKTYQDIVELEEKYGKPYHVMYEESFNEPSKHKTHEFCIPRIVIANKTKKDSWDRLYYYKVLAHELGHHFAIKGNGDRSEERANEIAANLILNHTPTYFRLIYGQLFEIVFDNNNKFKKLYGLPTGLDFWKLVWSFYWDYYRNRKKLNENVTL